MYYPHTHRPTRRSPQELAAMRRIRKLLERLRLPLPAFA